MRAFLLALLLVAAPLALPTGGAHISAFSQARSLTLGPYLAYLDPQPSDGSDLYANNSLSFSALISDNATGNYVTDIDASIVLRGPSDYAKTIDMARDSTGYLLASVILPYAGNYSADFILHDKKAGRDYDAATTFTAYPDLPVRIRSADASQDINVGARTTIAIETVDPVTGNRVDKMDDLQMDIEHWALDHSVKYDEHVVPMKHAGRGLWTYEYAFPVAGMFHLEFASSSGGFNYSQVPLLHLVANDAGPGSSASTTHKAPGASVGLAALGVCVAAIARRRR